MRSACLGARSVRSWITIRPLVVSITITFFLSRLAGSDCANAGTAKASAARKANRRIMETPDGFLRDEDSPGRDGLSQNPLQLLRRHFAAPDFFKTGRFAAGTALPVRAR